MKTTKSKVAFVLSLTMGVATSGVLSESIARADSIQLDSATGNYTITYTGTDGSQQVVTYVPSNKTDPYLFSHVHRNLAPNSFHYHYRLENGKSSQESLDVLALSLTGVPSDSAISNLSSPKRWNKFAAPVDASRSKRIAWTYNSTKSGLPPGKASGKFSFDAPALPGVALAQISGNAPTLSFVDEGPDESLGLEDLMKKTEWNTRISLVPMFYLSEPFNASSTLKAISQHLKYLVQIDQLSADLAAKLSDDLASAVNNLDSKKNAAAKKDLDAFIKHIRAEELKDLFDDQVECKSEEFKRPNNREISVFSARFLRFDVNYIKGRIAK